MVLTSSREKKTEMSNGLSWIITRASNGHVLTYDIFKSNGFDLDECHYTLDAAVVYTYVHFKAPVSIDTLTIFLKKMETESHIMPFEIFGYDSVSVDCGDAKLTEHVGFKVLMSHYQTKHHAFVACTDGTAEVTRGLLWDNDSSARIKQLLSARNADLCSFFEDLEEKLELSKDHEETIELLREEVQEYQDRVERYKEKIREVSHLSFVALVLRDRIGALDLDPDSRAFLFEPDHRGLPLFPA